MTHNLHFNRSSVSAGEAINEGISFPGFNYWLFFCVALIIWLILIVVGLIPIVNIYIQPLLVGPLMVGLYSVFLKQYDGEKADFVMAFDGFKKFVPAMLVSLIQAAPWIVFQTIQLFANVFSLFSNEIFLGGFVQSEPVPDFSKIFTGSLIIFILLFFLLIIIISIAIHITFFCAFPLLSEHDIGPIETIKLSARAGWSNAVGLILLAILQSLLLLVGFLACGIGTFFVLPVIYGSNVVAYRQIFPKTQIVVNDAPPSPSEYGDMFGQSG